MFLLFFLLITIITIIIHYFWNNTLEACNNIYMAVWDNRLQEKRFTTGRKKLIKKYFHTVQVLTVEETDPFIVNSANNETGHQLINLKKMDP